LIASCTAKPAVVITPVDPADVPLAGPMLQGMFVVSAAEAADTLGELQAQLPPRLVRSYRQPADAPEVVESGFPPTG
jgi:hypothetical protein